jgi:hypothetical protein
MTPVINNIDARVWPEIVYALHDRYEILYWCDLGIDDLDLDLDRLYSEFKQFENFTFAPNQRIVILHRETDYYTVPNADGFTLWNLFKIYSELNIPTEYTILLTSQPTVKQETVRLAQSFNLPNMQVKFIPYQWLPEPKVIQPIDSNVDQIQYPYVCLNGQPRMHRIYTLCQLHKENILSQGMVTFHPDFLPIVHLTNNKKSPAKHQVPRGMHLRTTYPATRINDTLMLTSEQHAIYHANRPHVFFTRKHSVVEGMPWGTEDPKLRYQPAFLQQALWNVVTETVGEYPHSFITEKTAKAILTKRPFIIIGGVGTLDTLHSCGFRTFSHVISENYDQLPTVADRIDSAVQELKGFCNMSPGELRDFYLEVQSITEYNFDHYMNNFGTKGLDTFIRDVL